MDMTNTLRAHGPLLLVEDHETFAQVLSRSLQQHGFSVHAAAAIDNALALTVSIRPAYVLLDLNLGGAVRKRVSPWHGALCDTMPHCCARGQPRESAVILPTRPRTSPCPSTQPCLP